MSDQDPSTKPNHTGQPFSRRKLLELSGGVLAGLVVAGCSPKRSEPATPIATTPETTPSTTPSTLKTKEQLSDPLSSEALWAMNSSERVELIRSLLPESLLQNPKGYVMKRIEIVTALYNMAGDQKRFDKWSETENPTGTNEDWASFVSEEVFLTAFEAAEGVKPKITREGGVWVMAARAGLIVSMQNQMNSSNGTPIKLPPYKFSASINSIDISKQTDKSFTAKVSVNEGDNITEEVITTINKFTQQTWKVDTHLGGKMVMEWAGVHYDPSKKIVAPSSETILEIYD